MKQIFVTVNLMFKIKICLFVMGDYSSPEPPELYQHENNIQKRYSVQENRSKVFEKLGQISAKERTVLIDFGLPSTSDINS